MPVVNPLARELVFKIVYYGPGLGGKTTTLQRVHATTRPEFRGKIVSLATPVDRTLYFDYLPLRIPDVRGMSVRLQLFTVPGQVYYNATRKLVLTGADGVVLVVDSQRARLDANLESLDNLEENLREHGRGLPELPFVLQWNKRDLAGVFSPDELDSRLNRYNSPAFETTATSGEGIFEALDAVTRLVLADFEKRSPASKRSVGQELQLPEGGLAAALLSATPAEAAEGPSAPVRSRTVPAAAAPPAGRIQNPLELALDEAAVGEDAARALTELGKPEFEVPSQPPLPDIAGASETSGAQPLPSAPLDAEPRPAGGGVSFAALFPESQQPAARDVEQALAAGDVRRSVDLSEQLVTRGFARVAHLVSHAEAPRDPALISLLLGIEGRRYLDFRRLVRDARGGHLDDDPSAALMVYNFAIEVWTSIQRGPY